MYALPTDAHMTGIWVKIDTSSYMQGIVVLIYVLKATYRRTVYRYLGHNQTNPDT